MQRIREGLYLLESGRTVNSYLIEGQGLTLVDVGPEDSLDALIAEIHAGGFRLDDLQRVVLTHAHPDHAGAAPALLRRKRVKVFAHPEEIPTLEGREGRPTGWFARLKELFADKAEPLPAVVPASPRDPIRGLARWQVLHLPGHSAGSLGLYDPANAVLLSGDAVSNRDGVPAIADSRALDLAVATRSASAIAKLDVEVIAPGHGPVMRPRAWKTVEGLLPSRAP